ncbi:MAG TPA: carotenoid oxygenase family protein [Kofleriaceae bacterium]|nr:carotenoid oxygenase family protein [Kofleriaceae bacterium]
MMATAYQRWVRGLRPVRDEHTAPARCIAGVVPRELSGTLYRVGPSQRILPPEGNAGLHLFDGDGLVQKLEFSSGQVTHTSRFVRTASFMLEQQSGRFNQHGLGTRAREPVRAVPMRQQQNTHVIAHAGRLLALVESALPVELAFDSLRRLGNHDFGLPLAGRPLAAHPKRVDDRDELFIHSCYPVAPYLQLHRIDRRGAVVWSADIELPAATWVHDIALTERHVIVPLSPVVLDVEQEDGVWIPTDPYAAVAGQPLGWIVCSRDDGRVCARIDSAEPALIVHTGRAWDDGADLVVEAVTYDDAAAYLAWLQVVRAGGWVPRSQARYARHRLDLARGRASSVTLIERASEFPRTDDRTIGGPARTTYLAIGAAPAGAAEPAPWDRIARLDGATGALVEHRLPPGVWPGEPVFAPRHPGAAEDDGFVLVIGYDDARDRSLLFVLDAGDLAAAPLATLELAARVPFGFHGSFVPAPGAAGAPGAASRTS